LSIIQSPYQIFSLERKDFLNAALDIFRFQAKNCLIYKDYIYQIGVDCNAVERLDQIPFLPIQFFKSHKVVSKKQESYCLFESSATSGQTTAKHYVADEDLYKESILKSFESAFGPVQDKVILGLLPHYLERKNSSLIYMVDYLMKQSGQEIDGFFLDKEEELFKLLQQLEARRQSTILFGVSFALLDFAKKFSIHLKFVQIIETGGMKGRGQEQTREVLHAKLQKSFGSKNIYSEYGMAELLSQSYYLSDNLFVPPPWKQVLIRDLYDPLTTTTYGKGALNIIDLANINSCSFIASEDIGTLESSGNFNVLGRMDASEIRGCNLLLND